MAGRSNISSIMVAVAVLLGFGIFLATKSCRDSGQKHFNWWPDYAPNSTEPYGAAAFRHVLNSTFGKDSVLLFHNGIKGLPKAYKDRGAYLFLGRSLYEEEEEEFLDSLFHFVEAGNEALLLTETFSFELLERLLDEKCDWLPGYYHYLESHADKAVYDSLGEEAPPYEDKDQFREDYELIATKIRLSFTGPGEGLQESYTLSKLFQNEPEFYTFEFLDRILLCPEEGNSKVLGYINDSLINFVRFNVGKGQVYLNTSPLAFTNHPLLHGQTLPYVDGVLANISSKKIYWDHSSQFDNVAPSGRHAWQDGPLHYVLSQPPLAIAWYLLLAMALLFLIFRAKRRQRIIPVLETNTNTTLEFLENIGSLYFMSGDYRHLLHLKMQLFLSFVRNQYRMPTQQLDEQFTKTLAMRSGVDAGIIEKILLIYHNAGNSNFVSQGILVEFHQVMERFYQQSRGQL